MEDTVVDMMALALGWCLVGILSVLTIGAILWLGAKVIDWRDEREGRRRHDVIAELEQQLLDERSKNYAISFDERAEIWANSRQDALEEVEDVLLETRGWLDGSIHEVAVRRSKKETQG